MLVVSWASAGTFTIGEKDFLLDDQPFVIRSGEMHYPRVPREYWAHRLRMIRALGLNTVSTYLFWSEHERRPGQFDFTGNLDVAEFCRQAQQEGLKVIVRPGPYVCAEWDMGGLPAWLLKDREVRLRTRDPRFLEPTRRYFKAVGEQLAPLQVTQGGPIILVQVENEYGGHGSDKTYLGVLRDYLREAGFEVPCFVHEMGWSAPKVVRDDFFCSVGFGGEAEKRFGGLRSVQRTGPLLCMEFCWGWFDS
jgi:beta-galactosidase